MIGDLYQIRNILFYFVILFLYFILLYCFHEAIFKFELTGICKPRKFGQQRRDLISEEAKDLK